MAKELDLNDNAAKEQDRKTYRPSEKPNPQKPQGKSLQVNENSVEDKGPTRSPARRGSGDKPNKQKLQGKALQVNDNSVED